MILGAKNKHKSKKRDGNNRTRSDLFGGVGGGGVIRENRKNEVCVTYEQVIRS